MKQTSLILVWLCLLVVGSIHAQKPVPNRLAQTLRTKLNQRSEEAIPTYSLFDRIDQSSLHTRSARIVAKTTILQMKGADALRIIRLSPELVELNIPFEDEQITVALFNQSPVSSEFTSTNSNGQISQNSGVHYRGIVKNDEQSIASFSVFESEIIGVISSTDLGNLIIGKWGSDEEHVIYREDDLLIENFSICEMLEVPEEQRSTNTGTQEHQRDAASCVQVYFETSFSLFQNKGSFNAVQNYVTGLFNNVATLYANENINVEISEIFIWTSADPFDHGSSSAAINSFISERSNFNGNVGHLLDISGRSNGGLAYVDVLCDNSFNVGYSDIATSYNNFPTYSWTVNVVTHELGHNFGSSHTHDCVWGPQNCTAIDGCSRPATNVGCGSCATAPIPPKGTIMSYCHVGGNGIDFNLGFGSEPGNLIRSKAAAASCLPQCGSSSGNSCNLVIENVIEKDATCSNNNGKLTIQVSGASGGVTYDIGNGAQSSNVFNNLTAGNYTVMVISGNGCDRSESANIALISEKPALAATVTNATCGQEDGVIELAASGGANPYSYRIGSKTQSSPIFSALAVGNYTAIVTDNNGCPENKQFAIFTDNPPNLQVDVSHTSCGNDNGTISLSAEGGTGPYTFKLGNQNSPNGQFNDVAAGSYQVLVADANGCTDDKEISVQSSQAITASAEVVATECGFDNGHITVNAIGGTGTLTYSLGNSFQSVNTFSDLEAGNYQLKVKDGSDCILSFDQEVQSSKSFALLPDIINTSCGLSNGAATINVEGNTGPYEYKLGLGIFTPTNEFTKLPAGLTVISVKDADGCVLDEQIEIQFSTVPTPLPQVDRTHCGEDNGSIVVNIEEGVAPYQFGLDGRFQSVPEFTSLAPGNYKLIVSDAEGCMDSTEVIVDTSEAVSATIEMLPTACGETNGSIHLQGINGIAPFTYSVNEQSTTETDFTGLAADDYPVTILDADHCALVDTVQVAPSNAILLETDITMTSCGLDNGLIRILASGGTGTLAYSLLDTPFTQQSSYQSLSAGNYRVQVKDEENCLVEEQVAILPSSNPEIQYEISQTRCGLDNGQIAYDIIGGEGPYQYSLNKVTLDGPTASNLHWGEYALKVIDKHGCVDSTMAIIETSTAPQLSVITESASCYQSNGQVSAAGTLGVGPYGYSIGGPFQSESEFVAVDSGKYLVVLRDQRDCLDTMEVQVAYDNQYPRPELPDETAICEGDPATLDIGLISAPSILWTKNGIELPETEPVVATNEPGLYKAQVAYHNDCILETTSNLVVYNKPTQELISADTICVGETFSIANPNEQWKYVWSNDATGAKVAFTQSGLYQLKVINEQDCFINKDLELTVVQPVSLDVADDQVYICQGERFQWDLVGADTYQWITQDSSITEFDISNPLVSPMKDQNYLVLGTNRCFIDTVSLSLHIHQNEVQITNDTVVIEGSPLTLVLQNNVTSANWESPYNMSCLDCLESIIRPEVSGAANVLYSDKNECEWIDTIHIDVIPLADVLPPLINVITPNEDGRNDELVFEGMDTFRQFKLEVFNQLGTLIYTSKDYQNNWKGTINGDPLPEGVYYYMITLLLDDRMFHFDSDLTIVRD